MPHWNWAIWTITILLVLRVVIGVGQAGDPRPEKDHNYPDGAKVMLSSIIVAALYYFAGIWA